MKERKIFRWIAVPVMVLLVLEIGIFLASLMSHGLIGELRSNEIEVVNEKVISRRSRVQNDMLHSWMNVSDTVTRVNNITRNLLTANEIRLGEFTEDYDQAALLLERMTPAVMTMMKQNRVTGAFVVLNTQDLSASMESGEYRNLQGIYMRNNDPNVQTFERRENVLMVRSPISVVQNLSIPMDSSWDVNFDFTNKNIPYYDFIYKTFQNAYENHNPEYTWKDMGYWSTAYRLDKERDDAIAYSVPLILEDGTVYGVLGVDITKNYISTVLSNSELGKSGTYFLGLYQEDKDNFEEVFGEEETSWIISRDDDRIELNRNDYYIHVEPLRLYESNTSFADEQWVLGGVMPYSEIYRYAFDLQKSLILATVLTLALGMVGCLLVSYRLQLPISRLVQELKHADTRENVQLKPTGITEIDSLSHAVERLSRDVQESGGKFSMIMQMASTWIAGFQMNEQENTLFVTNEFFAIFGQYKIDHRKMDTQQFKTALQDLESMHIETDLQMDGEIYQVHTSTGDRYIRLKMLQNGEDVYGLAEDVTRLLLEKQALTHERDHDSLTDLYNRRAFRRKMEQLFAHQAEKIGIGAFVMLDLDNLKYINDTYGHDYGDIYIRQAASALREGTDGTVYYARNSGDEFHVFFYGDTSKEAVRVRIAALQGAFANKYIELPDGNAQKLQISGGVSWYPDDAQSMDELARYADYAMYIVKKKHKGTLDYFDRSIYQSQSERLHNAAALTRLIEREEVFYAFQPIVQARTGHIYGYEALMRPSAKAFPSVSEVLDVARREGKLNQIETLTWKKALEHYVHLLNDGKISSESYIFINSIPNQKMDAELEQLCEQRYKPYAHQLVIELTENEQIEGDVWIEKQKLQRLNGGRIALDDFGTGYNGEKTLLSVAPDYVKIDMEIIRNIHKSPDKQAVVEYIVGYAHERNMQIIAEGVETEAEMRKVIEMGVDLLQGYYLARPAKDPGEISPEAIELIRTMQGENHEDTYGSDTLL